MKKLKQTDLFIDKFNLVDKLHNNFDYSDIPTIKMNNNKNQDCNCVGCGAPIKDDNCLYCGRVSNKNY